MVSARQGRAGRILSIILSVLFFVITCVFTALLLLRANNAVIILRNTDITDLLEDTEIAYYLVSQLNSLPFNDTEIELSDIEDFIKTDAVSDEIGNVLAVYMRALDRGDLEFHLTTEDVLDIVQNLEPEFSDMFDHRMTEADKMILTRTLDDILDFDGLTVAGIIYDAGLSTIVPRLLLSSYVLWGTGILLLMILSLIFLLNYTTIHKAFLLSGIPIALTGILYLAAGLMFDTFTGQTSGRLSALSKLAVGVVHLLIRHGTVLLAIGAAFIVICLVVRQSRRSA